MISVDRLKPVVSEDPVSAALLPACRHPALHAPGPSSSPPSTDALAPKSPRKGAHFYFHHLPLFSGTLAMLFGTEGPAPLFLRHYFWGDCCGGLMCAVLFLAELSHRSQLMMRTLNIFYINLTISTILVYFMNQKLNNVTVLNLSFIRLLMLCH